MTQGAQPPNEKDTETRHSTNKALIFRTADRLFDAMIPSSLIWNTEYELT